MTHCFHTALHTGLFKQSPICISPFSHTKESPSHERFGVETGQTRGPLPVSVCVSLSHCTGRSITNKDSSPVRPPYSCQADRNLDTEGHTHVKHTCLLADSPCNWKNVSVSKPMLDRRRKQTEKGREIVPGKTPTKSCLVVKQDTT